MSSQPALVISDKVLKVLAHAAIIALCPEVKPDDVLHGVVFRSMKREVDRLIADGTKSAVEQLIDKGRKATKP